MTKNRESKKVVLLIPNSRWNGKRPWINFPYAALILTAILKNDFDFGILDANASNLSEDDCKNALKDINPEAVMVSALSVEYHEQSHRAIHIAKKALPGCITVMGGVYPTVLDEEVLEDTNIDLIFMGHAEERMTDFLHCVLSRDYKALRSMDGIGFRDKNGKIIVNPVKSYIVDVKNMIKPDYSLIDLKKYLRQDTSDFHFNSSLPTATVITSYGCPYNCVFCASRTICGRGVAYRPIEDVIEEFEFLVFENGVKNILIMDDCFIVNRSRAELIMTTFIERNYNITWKAGALPVWHLDDELLELMKKSGCSHVNISIESGSQKTLDNIIHKPLNLEIVPGIVRKCRELDLPITASFVIGFPGETWDDIRETFCFAEKCNLDLAHFHIANPFPKTDLFQMAKEQNLLPEGFNFRDVKYFGFGEAFLSTEEFSSFELKVLRAFEWDRINFSTPEKIEKAAKIMLMSQEELSRHRRETRRKLGIHF